MVICVIELIVDHTTRISIVFTYVFNDQITYNKIIPKNNTSGYVFARQLIFSLFVSYNAGWFLDESIRVV